MPQDPSGLRKSAIVLLSLGEQHATELLRQMPPDAAERVRKEMSRVGGLREVSLQTRQQVLAQFCSAAQVMEQASATSPSSSELEPQAASSFSDSRIPPKLPAPQTIPQTAPQTTVHAAPADGVLDSIRDEHPQTIALVLSRLAPDQASEVLAGLEHHRKVEVIKRIARIEKDNPTPADAPEPMDPAEAGLRRRIGQVMGKSVRSDGGEVNPLGGVGAAAEILNSSDRALEQRILADLDAEEPSLAEQIRRVQSIFELLIFADDDDILRVIEELDHETVSLALRAAGPALKEKVLWNLSGEQAEQIEQEIAEVSPVAVSDIEAAQQRVAEVVHRLDAAGEIELLNRATPRAT